MKDVALEAATEIATTLFFALGTIALSAAGAYMERLGVDSVLGGQLLLGLWAVFVGGALLYVGVYLMGYRELRPRVARLLASR